MNKFKCHFYISKKILYISIFFCLFIKFSFAQKAVELESLYIKDMLTDSTVPKGMCSDDIVCSSELTTQFYRENKFLPVWSSNGNLTSKVKDFITVIKLSYEDGLTPKKYHINEINAILNKIKSNNKSIFDFSSNNLEKNSDLISLLGDLDLLLTDAFFLYTSHLVYGENIIINKNKKRKTFYFSQMFDKKSVDLFQEFNNALNGDIKDVLSNLAPSYSGYIKLKEKLLEYLDIADNGGWKKIPSGKKLKIGDHGIRVSLLQERLRATGELDINEKNIEDDAVFDKSLEEAVMRFQDSHDLDVDGEVSTETLKELNIPIATRIKQIKINMDRLRLLPNDLGERYVIINIPNFLLEVHDKNRLIFNMPVIVGRVGWRSCILSSKIINMEINPYWYVPRNIAIKEILPELKNDPNVLKQNEIRTFKKMDGKDVEIDSSKEDWANVESKNFSYLFRQDPGVLNPLGKVKFVFPNNCTIFLHDTPSPDLFTYSRRDFSHGCIRIGKPLELATYLVKNQTPWTKEKLLSKIESGKQETIKLANPLNIYVIYETVWVDANSILQFREDIYNMNNFPVAIDKPDNDSDED